MNVSTQNKPWILRFALFASFLGSATLAATTAQAAPDIPFVRDAMSKAQQAPTADGAWKIGATVLLFTDAGVKMVATGPLTPQPTGDLMYGTLPLVIDGDASGKTLSLAVSLNPGGTLGLQYLIENKAFLGRPMQFFQTKAEDGQLVGKFKWNGAERRLVLTLKPELVATSTTAPPPIRRRPPPIRQKKTPIGKRYQIIGRAVVTNADDGAGDSTVEIFGNVSINTRDQNGTKKVVDVAGVFDEKANKNAVIGFEPNLFLDHYFNTAGSRMFTFNGEFHDQDSTSGNDGMWNATSQRYLLDKLAGKGEQVIPGDRDDENVEVYFTVTEVGDIF